MSRDWNSAYENEDTPWDKGEAAPPLREFLSTHSVCGRVLVPGCGLGHDVRLLAEQGAEVIGMDIALGAVRKASTLPKRSTELYVVGDFLNLPSVHYRQFDWLVEHTCLCAIDPAERAAYMQSVALALKPGGSFLAIFYRVVADYTGEGPPHPISEADIEALFGTEFETLESFVPQQSYESRPYGSEQVVWMRKRG
jgi:SAM-dependent methyltransferase